MITIPRWHLQLRKINPPNHWFRSGSSLIFMTGRGRKKWWINDHCFTRAPDGTWHLLVSPTRKPPMPRLRQSGFSGPCTGDNADRTEWEKQPFALKAESHWVKCISGRPHIIGTTDCIICTIVPAPKNTEFRFNWQPQKTFSHGSVMRRIHGRRWL